MTETARLNDYTPDERIGVVARTEVQPGDHDWGGLTLHTSLGYEIGTRNPPTFADLVSSLNVRVSGGDLDDRADWHHNYTGLEPWFRAHVYRIGMGWQSTRLKREFNDNPWLADHPAFDTSEADSEEEMLATARGFISRYSNRWGIENGYKQIKQFRVRTTSKDHEYRYFNFAFACVLYNVWRLVDLLVKLAFEDDPDYSPRVQATTFLTLAGQHIGFDPPD